MDVIPRRHDVVLSELAYRMGFDRSIYIVRDVKDGVDWIGLTHDLDSVVPLLASRPSPGSLTEDRETLVALFRDLGPGRR